MPRSSRAVAERNRNAIIDEAVDEASVQGLEGLSLGPLAGQLGMSKAGVIGPFGSKLKLQQATLDRAVERFTETVWEPVADLPAGLPRLQGLIDSWLRYLEDCCFPGGCFLTAAAAELDGRPGPLREAVQATSRLWEKVLSAEVEEAVRLGQIDPVDGSQAAFELNAIAQGVNQAIQLHDDRDAIERGHRAMHRALGLPAPA